jgi:hypothetical protein
MHNQQSCMGIRNRVMQHLPATACAHIHLHLPCQLLMLLLFATNLFASVLETWLHKLVRLCVFASWCGVLHGFGCRWFPTFLWGMQESRTRVLPKPGDYTVRYEATVHNRGGQQQHRWIDSQAYKYKAVAGPVTECGVKGWPEQVHLGAALGPIYVELTGKAGNLAKSASGVSVSFSSDVLAITHEGAQWEEPEAGVHHLQLAKVVLEPTEGFKAGRPDTGVKCDVELRVTLEKRQLPVKKFVVEVYPGVPSRNSLICTIAYIAFYTDRLHSYGADELACWCARVTSEMSHNATGATVFD